MIELFLAIDAGTQLIRAAHFDLIGKIRGIVTTLIEPFFSTQPGWVAE
jgi:hypothetical protein